MVPSAEAAPTAQSAATLARSVVFRVFIFTSQGKFLSSSPSALHIMQTLCKNNFMTKKPDTPPTQTAPERKKRGAILVRDKLREAIQWLHLEPGSALDEVALAKEYEVSRTPIREALLLLSNEGFVQFLQNRTSIVAPLSLDNQAAFLDTFILLSRGLVRAAAQHGKIDQSELAPFVDAYAESLADGAVEPAFRAQLGLFRHIAAKARNRFLEKYFLEAQDASVRMKLLYFFPHLVGADRNEAVRRLTAVVEAMAAGDPEAADAAVRDSILFETRVIQAGLGPRFGHGMDLHIGDGA
jgi:DNA-binding GntR family transcriptional regulator